MNDKLKPKEVNESYEKLAEYAGTRTKEISGMVGPYIEITDKYGQLVSQIVEILGSEKPQHAQDIVIRDLMAEVFDFLYESRPLILAGKLNVAYPIARRAYESLSLLHVCTLNKSWAQKWHDGKKIGNAEIRRELENHPRGESEENLKQLYTFFCLATHPNRETIARRFLGEGNKYVLGVIGKPDLVILADYCIKTLEMWFWLTATVTYYYHKVIAKHDKTYFDTYMKAAEDAKKVNQWLVENYNNLLKEAQEYLAKNPITE